MPDILLDEEKMTFHYFLKVELIFALNLCTFKAQLSLNITTLSFL